MVSSHVTRHACCHVYRRCYDHTWLSTRSNAWTVMMAYSGSGLGLVTALTSRGAGHRGPAPASWPGTGAGLLLGGALASSTWLMQNCLPRKSRLSKYTYRLCNYCT